MRFRWLINKRSAHLNTSLSTTYISPIDMLTSQIHLKVYYISFIPSSSHLFTNVLTHFVPFNGYFNVKQNFIFLQRTSMSAFFYKETFPQHTTQHVLHSSSATSHVIRILYCVSCHGLCKFPTVLRSSHIARNVVQTSDEVYIGYLIKATHNLRWSLVLLRLSFTQYLVLHSGNYFILSL